MKQISRWVEVEPTKTFVSLAPNDHKDRFLDGVDMIDYSKK